MERGLQPAKWQLAHHCVLDKSCAFLDIPRLAERIRPFIRPLGFRERKSRHRCSVRERSQHPSDSSRSSISAVKSPASARSPNTEGGSLCVPERSGSSSLLPHRSLSPCVSNVSSILQMESEALFVFCWCHKVGSVAVGAGPRPRSATL